VLAARRIVVWTAVVLVAAPGFATVATADSKGQRSAQGDCEREAMRRGYAVLATRNFEQHKDGWSLDLQARDYRGRVSWGTCFVETRSGEVSLFGFGWGGDPGSGSGGSFEFYCASVDHKYRECQLPVDGRARLVKKKSDARCVEGRDWGQRGDRVWVDNGCRAKFEVTRGGGDAGRYVECRSDNGRYRECQIARGYSARLIRDDSGGRCRGQGAWGTRDGLVWVNYGCRGRFELTRGGGGSGGASGQQQRAEVQCRNQARREGVSVREVTPAVQHGSSWEATVLGSRAGQRVHAICRFHPGSNRAELFYSGGGWST
jgi:hypothetical protein